jgi:hypothetical protein
MFASMGGCCFGNSFSLFQFFCVFFALHKSCLIHNEIEDVENVGNGDEVSNEKM